MAAVITDDRHYKDIADVIRDKGPYPEGTFKPEQMAQNIQYALNYQYSKGADTGMAYGKQAEYDAFWDAYQQNGERVQYQQAFAGTGWTDEIYNPKYPIRIEKNCWDMNECFNGTNGITDLKVPVIFGEQVSGAASTLFRGCTRLKTIPKIVLNENIGFTIWFSGCFFLENLTIEGTIGKNGFDVSSSSKLTHKSLMNIINVLKDYSADTSGTTYTCTLGATNLAKLTDAEKAIATQKGWSLV